MFTNLFLQAYDDDVVDDDADADADADDADADDDDRLRKRVSQWWSVS